MISDIRDSTPVSAYDPSSDVKEITNTVRLDYALGHEILHKGFTELSNRSVIADMNRGQKTFNAFVDEEVEDESEAWKWLGTRSKARNKAIALHTHITSGYIVPMFMAQNESDEEDRDFSDGMRDCVKWLVSSSNYKSSFLMASMGMLVNPVTYLGAEWNEVTQKIKTKQKQGYSEEEIRDEVLSGFQAPVYSADQVLISNAYEQNIQKHRAVIKRRYVEKQELEAKYGEHENWKHVQNGIKSIYSEGDGLFYDVKDEDHPFLVEEVTYLNRREDTEICYLNGIYMGDSKVEWNPIKHRDNRDAPKYNVVPFGYQRVNEHFFYYKSLMNSMYWDNMLIDEQYKLAMNRAFLDTNMPIAVTGGVKIDSDVIFPSAVISELPENTKVQPLLPQADLSKMFGAMRETERSMDEASVSETMSGGLPDNQQKATSVALSERNARQMLQGVGKTLAESVVQYGDLMADIVVNQLSIADVMEVTGGKTKLKYKTLILKDEMVGGKQSDKIIKFDESMLGMEMTDDEKRKENLRMYGDAVKNKKHLYRFNPELFARMKYLTRVEPERMFPQNEEYQQALMTQVYSLLRGDPLVSGEALVRKLLYSMFRGEAEDMIQEQQQMPGQAEQIMGAGQPVAGQQAVNQATGRGLVGVGMV